MVMVIMALAWLAGPAEAAKKKRPPKPVKVQLLAINDFHGHLDPDAVGHDQPDR